MKCQWCNKGTYRQVFTVQRDDHGVPRNLYKLEAFGLRVSGDGIPEVWACGDCGHVAIVRPDLVLGPKAA